MGALLPLPLLLMLPAQAGDAATSPRGATTAAAYQAPPAPPPPPPAPPAPVLPLVTLELDAAAHCARSQVLVGDGCSFTTGMTARRVVDEGTPWTWAGTLTTRPLAGEVAAPYLAGETDRILATELLEVLLAAQHEGVPCLFIGRALEIDGATWVVLTAYAPADT